MTGTYPAQHGVYEGSSKDESGRISHVLPESAYTLAELFKDHGFRTAAFVQNAQLRKGQGIEQGFDLYTDRAGDAHEIGQQAVEWLDQQNGTQPFFLYLHLLDAHWPYPIPDEYASAFVPLDALATFRTPNWKQLRDEINSGSTQFGETERLTLEGLYDGAIRYADHELGLVFDGLRARKLWTNTIVCVISDHGEEFGEHGRIGHGHGLFENLLRVPWILRLPGRAPAKIQTAVSLVDLLPTLGAAANLETPSNLLGVNRLDSPDVEQSIFAEHKAPDQYMQSLRDGDRKLVRRLRIETNESKRLWPIAIGERWEVELERNSSGQLLARQIKPRDESTVEPTELKGILTACGKRTIEVSGIELNYDSETLIRRSDDSGDLEPGVMVKVKFEATDVGRRATQVKLYSSDAKPDFEIRGVATELNGTPETGTITIGGLTAIIDDETTYKNLPNKGSRISRAEVHRFLAGQRNQTDQIFEECHDLEPGSKSEIAPSTIDDLSSQLSQFNFRLAREAFYKATDTSVLSEEQILQLEAIGYVE
ncbi:MAG: hypothetical protein ACI8TQ_001121 [Planctomycetota bacterium]|jgi:hypothetical protein